MIKQEFQAAASADSKRTASLISLIGISPIGSVIDRLEARGLVRRAVSPTDKRVRQVFPMADGERLLARVVPLMLRSQKLLLAPLTASERKVFMNLMRKLVDGPRGERYRQPRPPVETHRRR